MLFSSHMSLFDIAYMQEQRLAGCDVNAEPDGALVMRIQEPLFKIINLIVRATLSSPLHSLMSNSFLVIHHTGRKSGRAFATPVRYLRTDTGLRCTTGSHTQWWRNVQASPEVSLQVAGVTSRYRAQLVVQKPERSRPLLVEFLTAYPQDAVYHDIRLNKQNQPDPDDLEAALREAVIVDFEPV